jgi:hypothetical protein
MTITLTTTNSLGQTVIVATTTTDVNGAFSFTGLAPGNYTITEFPGSGFTDDWSHNVISSAGGSTSANQFNLTLDSGVIGTGYTFENLFSVS